MCVEFHCCRSYMSVFYKQPSCFGPTLAILRGVHRNQSLEQRIFFFVLGDNNTIVIASEPNFIPKESYVKQGCLKVPFIPIEGQQLILIRQEYRHMASKSTTINVVHSAHRNVKAAKACKRSHGPGLPWVSSKHREYVMCVLQCGQKAPVTGPT